MTATGVVMVLCTFCVLSGPAHAGPRDGEWAPPARYDHPYPGALIVHKIPQSQLPAACKALFARHNVSGRAFGDIRGCSAQGEKGWEVITIDKTYKKATPDAVLRHETGHCNGWPSDHPD
jgi:hypothetical protein